MECDGLVDAILAHQAIPHTDRFGVIYTSKYALAATDDPEERELIEAWERNNGRRLGGFDGEEP
jgi:hypothetical protein